MGNPLEDLFTLRERINKLFEESHPKSIEAESVTWVPPVDIYETSGEYVVKAELPDVKESDIDIRVESDVVTLRGEKPLLREGRYYHQVERSFGIFARSFSLPTEVDKDAMTATLKDGILKIVIPKKGGMVPLRVEIRKD
ncbi:MAG: Hsp20/alpha crystallin family protein [Chloroflexota bacterium]